jgi:hypothetical protein
MHARSLTRSRPRLVLLVMAVSTGLLSAAAPFTRWDASPDLLTVEGSPELRAYRSYLARFGSDELVVLAFERRDLLEPDGLRSIRTLTDDLARIEGVEDVTSLDTVFEVDLGPFGPFPRPLMPDNLAEAPPKAAMLERIRALPTVRDGLVDAAGETAAIVIKPRATGLGSQAQLEQRAVLEGINAVLAGPEYAGLDPHLAGSPVFDRELERLNTRDNAIFTPLTAGLVAVLLVVALRSLPAVVLAMACVGGTVGAVRGTMTLVDVPINTTTSLLAPLLMVLAVCVSVHMLSRYQRERADGASVERAVDVIESSVLIPAALTAVTTAIGFLSLFVSPIPSVRSFGIFAALGTGIAFLLGGVAVPAALRCLGPAGRAGGGGTGLAEALASLAGFAERRAVPVLVITVALSLVGALSLPRLRVSTHDGEFFPADHPLNVAYRFIEARLGGVTPLELILESKTPGGIKRPEALAAISDLQAFLAAQPETLRGVSIADWVALARSALEPPARRAEPPTPDALERAAFLLEAVAARDLPYWVRDDWSVARVSSRSVALDSERNDALLARLERFAHERLATLPDLRATVTGLVPVFARMEEYLLASQVQSFGLAFASIFAVFALVLRSLGWAVVAMIPNALPVLWTLCVMALFGIPLDVVTVMIASITLGIVVDDTTHLLHGFREARAAGRAPGDAMSEAILRCGHALVFTTLVLSLGFGTLCLSEFRPTARFGLLTSVTIVSGLLAELLVLPALVHAVAPLRIGSLVRREQA